MLHFFLQDYQQIPYPTNRMNNFQITLCRSENHQNLYQVSSKFAKPMPPMRKNLINATHFKKLKLSIQQVFLLEKETKWFLTLVTRVLTFLVRLSISLRAANNTSSTKINPSSKDTLTQYRTTSNTKLPTATTKHLTATTKLPKPQTST